MESIKNTDERIHNLVKEQFGKMKMSKKYSNQARLSNKCEYIVYNEWGIFNERIQHTITKYVEKYIPNHFD